MKGDYPLDNTQVGQSSSSFIASAITASRSGPLGIVISCRVAPGGYTKAFHSFPR